MFKYVIVDVTSAPVIYMNRFMDLESLSKHIHTTYCTANNFWSRVDNGTLYIVEHETKDQYKEVSFTDLASDNKFVNFQ